MRKLRLSEAKRLALGHPEDEEVRLGSSTCTILKITFAPLIENIIIIKSYFVAGHGGGYNLSTLGKLRQEDLRFEPSLGYLLT